MCVDGPVGVGISVHIFVFSINNRKRASTSEALSNEVGTLTHSVDASQPLSCPTPCLPMGP